MRGGERSTKFTEMRFRHIPPSQTFLSPVSWLYPYLYIDANIYMHIPPQERRKEKKGSPRTPYAPPEVWKIFIPEERKTATAECVAGLPEPAAIDSSGVPRQPRTDADSYPQGHSEKNVKLRNACLSLLQCEKLSLRKRWSPVPGHGRLLTRSGNNKTIQNP